MKISNSHFREKSAIVSFMRIINFQLLRHAVRASKWARFSVVMTVDVVIFIKHNIEIVFGIKRNKSFMDYVVIIIIVEDTFQGKKLVICFPLVSKLNRELIFFFYNAGSIFVFGYLYVETIPVDRLTYFIKNYFIVGMHESTATFIYRQSHIDHARECIYI